MAKKKQRKSNTIKKLTKISVPDSVVRTTIGPQRPKRRGPAG